MSCPLGAIQTSASLRVEGRVILREWCVFQDEQYVVLDPLLEIADGQQDAFALAAASPILAEASGECLFLLCWLEFCQ